MSDNILEIKHLKTYFFTARGVVKAVDDISFGIGKGENLCLVGESGCGKTATALSILRLVDSPPGRIVAGEILYHGENLLRCSGWRLHGTCELILGVGAVARSYRPSRLRRYRSCGRQEARVLNATTNRQLPN